MSSAPVTMSSRLDNRSERDPCNSVVDRKVIGGYHFGWSAEASATITTLLTTARQRGDNSCVMPCAWRIALHPPGYRHGYLSKYWGCRMEVAGGRTQARRRRRTIQPTSH